jgi:hypothetical protein
MPLASLGAALGALLAAAAPATPAPTGAPAPAPGQGHVIDEKERALLEQTDHVRLSLPTESDRQAWDSPGLRVSLGWGTGALRGLGPAWSFSSTGVALRPGVRIDRHWALAVSMFYGAAPSGVRWSVTAEPTFYIWRQLAVSVGLGYGGISTFDVNAPDNTGGFLVSRDLSDNEKLRSCEGVGLSSLARIEHLFVVGPLFATGPYLQGTAQWTRCQETLGRVDNETGQPLTLSQWWRHIGWNAGWWFVWR